MTRTQSIVQWTLFFAVLAGVDLSVVTCRADSLEPGGVKGRAAAPFGTGSSPRIDWYGIYMSGVKVGHARSSFAASGQAEGHGSIGVVADMVLSLRLRAGATQENITIRDVRMYGVNSPHVLERATYEQRSSQTIDRRQYIRKGGDGVVTRKVNGEASPERVVRASKETAGDQLTTWSEGRGRLGHDGAFKGHTFVWDTLEDASYQVTLQKQSSRVLHGVRAQILDFAVKYPDLGLDTSVELSNDGRILAMSIGSQFRLKLEEREIAQAGVSGLDVANAGVMVNRSIGEVSRLQELHVRVSLPDGQTMESRGRRASAVCRDSVCDIRIRRAPGNRVTKPAREKALQADQFIDHDKPDFRKLATRITAGKAGEERVRALVTYVNRNLRKRLATNLPSASAVLKAGFGDCTEHAWLFVALARAIGLPSRTVYGLAYLEGEMPRFGYHAWAEVEWDGHWVEVDPTWGEYRAGVGHIAFGQDAHAMATVYGSLRIDVLGTGPRQPAE